VGHQDRQVPVARNLLMNRDISGATWTHTDSAIVRLHPPLSCWFFLFW
jgi:hypothetical protein